MPSLLHTLAQDWSLTPKRRKSFTSPQEPSLATATLLYVGADSSEAVQASFYEPWPSSRTKTAIYNAICISTLLYACEGWTPYRRHIRALEAFHIRCLQTIVHVHWWDKIPHVEIRPRVGTTSLETTLLRRQLRWLGHVIRIPGNRLPAAYFIVNSPAADVRWGAKRSVLRTTLSRP